MARQNTTPVSFDKTNRTDTSVLMGSGRAGVCQMVGYVPLLRGDSASGSVGIDVDLAPMPRPLRNGVTLNFQAWFVPKTVHPQFSGYDEFMASYQRREIKALMQPTRAAPPFFHVLTEYEMGKLNASQFARDLGLHFNTKMPVNADLFDAYSLVYNFRLAAHSTRLPRRKYFKEDRDASFKWGRAFWPSSKLARVVPDYEKALVVGSFDLDVAAGRLPVAGVGILEAGRKNPTEKVVRTKATGGTKGTKAVGWNNNTGNPVNGEAWFFIKEDAKRKGFPDIYAEMAGQSVNVTLADIEKARTTQAFGNLRTSYAGTDHTGFIDDDMIVAELMQGFAVPEQEFKRPWLLDSKRVAFGFQERYSSTASDLNASTTEGRTSARLSLNVPKQDVGGVIIFTVEVLPERILERASDEWMQITNPDKLPDALRDIQRPSPVDMVRCRRVDARHNDPNALYGYEPMNDVWNRETVRLGGTFYSPTPGAPWKESRASLWYADVVNQKFGPLHYLAPDNFPHTVFKNAKGPAFEFVCRHSLSIYGLTQIGDVLQENNDDFKAVQGTV